MNEGKYVFTQVMGLVLRQIFQRLVIKYNGDYRVREFNCSNQLRYMLFGQLRPCKTLRDICLCLNAHRDILYGLGITVAVNESSLSRANESRDYRIYEGLGQAMNKQVYSLIPGCDSNISILRTMMSSLLTRQLSHGVLIS